jgi:cob(I)alamin adenosyltransferase
VALKRGYIQVYTGDGKGKTTAAMGLAMRALGHGLKVYAIQFMKGGSEHGEAEAFKRFSPDFTLKQMGRGEFVDKKNPGPKDIEIARSAFELAKKVARENSADVLILDEINVAMDFGLIDVSDVLKFLGGKPARLEVVLTGRSAPKEIIAQADLVTEMREVKHYYKDGVAAREGIEL